MSQENVEIAERAIAAVNTRDVEAYLACCTEDIELHTPVAAVAGVYEGPGGIQRFFSDVEDAAPDFHLHVESVRPVGDALLAFLNVTATGRASGLPAGTPTANVYEFANGKIRRVRMFADRTESPRRRGAVRIGDIAGACRRRNSRPDQATTAGASRAAGCGSSKTAPPGQRRVDRAVPGIALLVLLFRLRLSRNAIARILDWVVGRR